MKKKLLLVGLDSFDWKVIDPLLKKGFLPNLEKLIQNGSSGQLETLDPPFSPMLWTSIATGKTADKHGIYGFVEPDALTGKVRPVSSVSRKSRALWNIFSHQKLVSNVIGWWPSSPVEPINGVMLSNNYQKDVSDIENWPLSSDDVHPKKLRDVFKDLRVHPSEISPNLILDFVPNAENIDQSTTKKLSVIAKVLAHSFTIRNAAVHAMRKNDWDFTAVYFDAPDHFSHAFMKYHPPKLPTVSAEDYENYKNVINACYVMHDVIIGDLLQAAGPQTDVMILSDHGFHSDHLRPLSLPKISAAPALEHNPYGVLITAGKNFKQGIELCGKNLLDIAPTILNYFDLPAAEDMDGSSICEVLNSKSVPDKIGSWENVSGDFAEFNDFEKEFNFDNSDSLKQLEELGYIEKEEGASDETRVQKVTRDAKYNLSKVHKWKGENEKSLAILEQLYQEDPEDIRFNLDLIHIYIERGLYNSAADLITKFKTNANVKYARVNTLEAKILRLSSKYNEAISLLHTELKERPESTAAKLEMALCYRAKNNFQKAKELYEAIVKFNINNSQGHFGLGICQKELGLQEKALHSFLTCAELNPKNLSCHIQIGRLLTNLKHFKEAKTAYDTALHLNKNLHGVRDEYADLLKKLDIDIDHFDSSSEVDQAPIYVVTGLPRSGTSMMMQVLEAAGINIYTDNERIADDSNPKGYYEYEPVKHLHKQNKWLKEVESKGIKIVMPHIFKLPPRHTYKVIHIERKLDDVLMSQELMKERLNPAYQTTFNFSLYTSFTQELEKLDQWVNHFQNVERLKLNYDQVIAEPLIAAEKVKLFVNSKNDIKTIAQAIDPELKRSNIQICN